MKSILVATIIGILVVSMPLVLAQETEVSEEEILEIEPGITPDSVFYGFKRFGEGIHMWLTFDRLEKAKLRYNFAQIRLAEAVRMVKEKKQEIAERVLNEYENDLANIDSETKELVSEGRNISDITEIVNNATYKNILVLQRVYEKVPIQAKPAIKRAIENSLEKHIRTVKRVDIELVNMTITVGNKTVTKMVPARFADRFLEKDFEIGKKIKKRIEIKNKLEIKEMILEKISEIKANRALRQIEEAREAITEAEEKIASTTINATHANVLLEKAKNQLELASDALDENKTGRAFGHAIASERLAKNAERIVDRLSEIKERVTKTTNVTTASEEAISEIEEESEEQVERVLQKIRIRAR